LTGPVSVPVKLFSASHDHEVSFHQFQRGTSDRIRATKKANAKTSTKTTAKKAAVKKTAGSKRTARKAA